MLSKKRFSRHSNPLFESAQPAMNFGSGLPKTSQSGSGRSDKGDVVVSSCPKYSGSGEDTGISRSKKFRCRRESGRSKCRVIESSSSSPSPHFRVVFRVF